MIDIHVHYFPPRLFEAIWRFFAQNDLWKVRYQMHGEEHVKMLQSFGVERFTSLVYAHKPGLADHLNAFVYEEAARIPAMLPFGTVYAGDGNTGRQAEKLFDTYGFHGIKLHPFVSLEDLDDPRFFPCYAIMEGMGKVLICHPGSAPVYRDRAGDERLRRVLQQFPGLRVIIAHCGATEYDRYERLAQEFEWVFFDTAMNCVHTEAFPGNCPGRDFFVRLQDRIVYGSDYPNIPYEYPLQLEGLKTLGLGPDIEAKLFRGNALCLLGLPPHR